MEEVRDVREEGIAVQELVTENQQVRVRSLVAQRNTQMCL